MEQPHPLLERLIFPTLCLVVSSLMLYEQLTGTYRDESRAYVMFLAIPVLLLSLVDLVSVLLRRTSVPAQAGDSDRKEARLPYVRPVIFLVVALGGVSVISYLGFPIVFAAISLTAMVLAGERHPLRLLALPVAIVATVHFIFVGVLGLDLPYGAIWNA